MIFTELNWVTNIILQVNMNVSTACVGLWLLCIWEFDEIPFWLNKFFVPNIEVYQKNWIWTKFWQIYRSDNCLSEDQFVFLTYMVEIEVPIFFQVYPLWFWISYWPSFIQILQIQSHCWKVNHTAQRSCSYSMGYMRMMRAKIQFLWQ